MFKISNYKHFNTNQDFDHHGTALIAPFHYKIIIFVRINMKSSFFTILQSNLILCFSRALDLASVTDHTEC